MRFNVIEEKFGNQLLIKLVDSETREYVSILPETGGMLNSMEILFNNKLVPVLDDYKTENELIETLDNSFKGSNLFPFPNRIKDGVYSFNNKKYQLHLNFPNENNAIHGLIYSKPFKLVAKQSGEKSATCTLEYNADGTSQGFPFKYRLQVIFIFSKDSGLTVETLVENTGTTEMPTGNGWHPYFKLKSKVDELYFQFPSGESFETDKQMIPNGKAVNFEKYHTETQIGKDNFDTCFSIKTSDIKASIILKDPALNGGLEIWQETGINKFNFLQVYTPPHRNTIALEPMTCMPDAFNNQKGIIVLKPRETVNFSWGVNKL